MDLNMDYKQLILAAGRFDRRAASCWSCYRRSLNPHSFSDALYWHSMAQKMREAARSIPVGLAA